MSQPPRVGAALRRPPRVGAPLPRPRRVGAPPAAPAALAKESFRAFRSSARTSGRFCSSHGTTPSGDAAATSHWAEMQGETSARIAFFGNWVDGESVFPQHSKVHAVVKMPPPTDMAGLRRFLGIVGYYGKFIQQMTVKRKPLT
eukprot:jgi/Tetstr1/441710/TSEL_029933.t1